MWFLIMVVFAGGKNFARNFWANPSQVVMVPGGSEFSRPFSLSLSENGKSLNLITSSETPLCLKVSHISKSWQYECSDHHWAAHKIVPNVGSSGWWLAWSQSYWLVWLALLSLKWFHSWMEPHNPSKPYYSRLLQLLCPSSLLLCQSFLLFFVESSQHSFELLI